MKRKDIKDWLVSLLPPRLSVKLAAALGALVLLTS